MRTESSDTVFTGEITNRIKKRDRNKRIQAKQSQIENKTKQTNLLMDPNSDTIYNSEDDNKENITQKVISLMALIKHYTGYIK